MPEQRQIEISLFGVKVLPRERIAAGRRHSAKMLAANVLPGESGVLGVCNSPLVKVSS